MYIQTELQTIYTAKQLTKNGKERRQQSCEGTGNEHPRRVLKATDSGQISEAVQSADSTTARIFCLNADKRHENPTEDSVHTPFKIVSMSLAALYFSEETSPQSMY